MRPWPATSIEQTISWLPIAVGRLEGAQRGVPRGVAVLAEDVQRGREALEHGALDLAVVGEHHESLARGAEVVDPGERGVQLAARGEQLERVQPHEALGAQRRRDPRVELAQVERLALQPRDDVALGEAVLGLVVELDRHHAARLGGQLRQHVGLQAPHEAARAQVPVQAQVGVGAAEALAELGARAEVGQPPEDPQLRDQLRRAVHHGRARQREHEAVARHRRGQPLHGLGALGGRVLAVVGLVEHERARRERPQRVQPRGDDVVVDDGDVRRARAEHPRRCRLSA